MTNRQLEILEDIQNGADLRLSGESWSLWFRNHRIAVIKSQTIEPLFIAGILRFKKNKVVLSNVDFGKVSVDSPKRNSLNYKPVKCSACKKPIPKEEMKSPTQRYHLSEECQSIRRQRAKKQAKKRYKLSKECEPEINKIWRKCIGPIEKAHFFWSEGSHDRICANCKAVIDFKSGGMDDAQDYPM